MAHGSPDFRVRGKTFASFVINHHGDGRVALWLNAPQGAQAERVRREPKQFFVPPYLGPRGWLGVNLDKGISWKVVAQLVREAYVKVAPTSLARSLGDTIAVAPPTKPMKPEEIDPLQSKRAQFMLKQLRAICLALPESSEGPAIRQPGVARGKESVCAGVLLSRDAEAAVVILGGRGPAGTADTRSAVQHSAYMGHNGWIALDVTRAANWREIRSLALFSYRHFANGGC